MDRKAFAACAAGCTILACAISVAWRGSCAGVAWPLENSQPALLEVGQLKQCAWQQLDENVVRPAPELAESAASRQAPLVTAAKPPHARQSAPVPAPRENPELSPVATPAGLVEEVDVDQEVADDEPEAVEADPLDDSDTAEAGPLHTPLPWAHANSRTSEMFSVMKRAEGRVRYGFQLARRGAVYSARGEFVAALQMIAAANDAQQDTRLYGKALSAGLTAIREAGVFVRLPADRPDMDVHRIAEGHRTPVLKNSESVRINATTAAQRYYTYAQEQLAAAAAREVTGSMALFALAKVTANSPISSATQGIEHTAQAIAFYQAALLCEPRNYLAANELGVLEVANGNLTRARELFVHSTMLAPRACTWQNLVVVHTRLGEKRLAEQAKQRLAALPKTNESNQQLTVEWLDPSVFAATTPLAEGLAAAPAPKRAPVAQPATKPASNVEQPAAGPSKKGIADLLPWNSRR